MARRLLGVVLAGLVLAGLVPTGPALASSRTAAAGPRRIVSLNLCADELLVRLADREQIASVTWLARDPRASTVAAAAADLPVNHGMTEEIAAARPDLVLVGRHTTRTPVALLRRLGITVVELDLPRSLDDVRAQIRAVAAAVGHPARGEAAVAALDRHLAAVAAPAPAPDPGPVPGARALVLRPAGYTVGPGSLVDTILERAGLRNVAAELGIDGYGQVPLETVVMAGAEVLVVDGEAESPSLATEILGHPVIGRLAGRVRLVPVPVRLWACGGPQVADAVRILAAAARQDSAP
ncbi:ABC transporter substrate-binding protein [Arenibaculum pallidiluteum]|uniref:ABC transporter substrate-binding protein n=1 Tax=Arenibaculum pallidiluteum TaxID=2812559 RepID=UPI001A96AD8E|nr:ABC transporter substrate-binding protein [Arenibaculum pallidiluteum]